MSTNKKDIVIFCKKQDHEIPSKYDMPPALPNEGRRGVILPNGEINWMCPCLGVLPYGPCGYEFRQFFSCLPTPGSDESTEATDERREQCIPQFRNMMDCMSLFPQVYPPEKRSKDESKSDDANLDNKKE